MLLLYLSRPGLSFTVMAGLVPAISLRDARPCLPKRGHRVKPGGDKELSWPGLSFSVMAGLVPAIPISKTRLMKQYHVYIAASRPGGALYVGMTNDLVRRIYEHKNGLIEGHTKRYGIDQLVYFEIYDTAYAAIQREKNIKHWPRAWKTRLIAQSNPTWRDLYDEITT